MPCISVRSPRNFVSWGLVVGVVAGALALSCGESKLVRSDFTNASTASPEENGGGEAGGTVAEMASGELDALCDDINDRRLDYDVDAIERGYCKVAAFTAAQEGWPGDDAYETCESVFGSCIDDVDAASAVGCPVADVDEDGLSGCNADADALLDCMDERFEGAQELASIATCDDDTLAETGRVEDDDVADAGEKMTGEGTRCQQFFSDCPDLDPN